MLNSLISETASLKPTDCLSCRKFGWEGFPFRAGDENPATEH